MTENYKHSGRRNKISRRRRRRQLRKLQMFVAIASVLMASGMVIGFASHAGMEKEKPSRSPQAHQEPVAGVQERLEEDGRQEEIGLESGTESVPAQTAQTNLPWYLTLVNDQNPIPKDCEPELKEVQGGEYVDERIFEPLMEMLEAAREGNWDELPCVVSGYRTAEKQQSLYDEKIASYKKEGYSESEATELAGQWVAVPEHSEHQLGFAVDINGATYDVYLWLQENSYQYGFIFRYPGNKTHITGVAEEVWHYRYVGVEAATEMYEQGLCLEEYLERMQGE